MSSSRNDSWVGRFLGEGDRYRIDRSLNKGGMGDVYLALDTRLDQQVAVKLLKESLAASGEMHKRFKREVALCAALDSVHIVRILDSGTSVEGFPFYVMEYLKGRSLGQLLQRERQLPAKLTIDVIRQVCAGLQLAHEGVTLAGEHVKIVYRDLKPDNIFLVPTSLGTLAKILDFGIAKKIRDSSSGYEYTNLTNMFVGTFRYAAPEQLAVRQDIDGRADIYSLGIILYKMLSGTDPFGLGSNSRPVSETSWAQAHAFQAPQPLRSQAGCEQFSPELEAVVMKCLQKSPRDRFASMQELQQALDVVLPIENDPSPPEAHQPLPAGSDSQTVPRPLTPSAKPEVIDNVTTAQTPPAPAPQDHNTIVQIPNTPPDNDATVHRPLTAQSEPGQIDNATTAQIPAAPAPQDRNTIDNATTAQIPAAPAPQDHNTIVQIPSSQPVPPQEPGLSNVASQSSTSNQIEQEPTSTSVWQPGSRRTNASVQGYGETIFQQPRSPSRGISNQSPSPRTTTAGRRNPYETIYQQPRFQFLKYPQQSLSKTWSLISALVISLADAIALYSNRYREAQQALNECRLSYAIELARNGKFQDAIAIASQIPETSLFYAEAQAHIRAWKRI